MFFVKFRRKILFAIFRSFLAKAGAAACGNTDRLTPPPLGGLAPGWPPVPAGALAPEAGQCPGWAWPVSGWPPSAGGSRAGRRGGRCR